ncbi:MAG: flagellar biosynthetic protein FliR [Acidobacteriaceae bacterium]|nr:flagellar biosynthetic protein FliR [Acidobacteriaceae bacterium]
MQLSLVPIMGALLTISVRLSGLMLFAPMFGSVAIPVRVKAIFVLALTVLLYPMLSARMPAISISQWPTVVLGELLIGIALGVATNVVFDGVQMAGQILSIQMGYSLVNILDPQTQVDSTVVALFHQTMAMLIFLRLGVHFWILRAIVRSFDYLPPSAGHFGTAFTVAALHVAASAFSIGIQIAAPVLSATLLADVALGLLGKASPQLPLMLLGPAVKSLLGILVMLAALRYWPALFERLFSRSMVQADHLLHLAG